MSKTRIRYQRPVISGTILLLRGGLGEVRRHVAPDGTRVVSIVKIDLSNAPTGRTMVIRTDDGTLARAIATNEAVILDLPRPVPPPPRRIRGETRRSHTSPRPSVAHPASTRADSPWRKDLRRKVEKKRRLLRIDAALSRARRHAGPRGVHDQASARRAMADLRAAGILFSGCDLFDANAGSRKRRG